MADNYNNRPLLQQVDVGGALGEFLASVRVEDLVVEMVQNELDAGSTLTRITFGPDAFVCEGNGRAVDAAAWARIATMLGAGTTIAAKEDGIGAKNHGLRTGFKLGDRIFVQSDGFGMELTLLGDESQPGLYKPGSYPLEVDEESPKEGTRITIPYRRNPISVGDRYGLDTIDDELLERLRGEAIAQAPTRFIGVVPWRDGAYYRLEIGRSDGDRSIFSFDITTSTIRGAMIRTCKERRAAERPKLILREQSLQFQLNLSDGDVERIPPNYRERGKVFGEVSWQVDRVGRPVPNVGRLRYPIAYPAGDHPAYSEHAFHISGPYHSDSTRHGVTDVDRNRKISAQGRAAMAGFLRDILLPKHGGRALALIRRAGRPNPTSEAAFADELIEAGALPINVQGKRRSPRTPLVDTTDENWKITVAAYAGRPSEVAFDLQRLCPPGRQLLARDVPTFGVAAILAASDARSAASKSPRVGRYTEADVVSELAPIETRIRDMLIKGAPSASQTDRWLAMLGVVQEAIDRRSLNENLEKRIAEYALFPTATGVLKPKKEVLYSRSAIPFIDGVSAPTVIHPKAASFRFLREGALRLKQFKIDNHLSNLDFSPTSGATRDKFVAWLAKNNSKLAPSTLRIIAGYPVWATTRGDHVPLDRFCLPRHPILRDITLEIVPQPAEAVRSFPNLRSTSRGAIHIRTRPSLEELRSWHTSKCLKVRSLYDENNLSFHAAANELEDKLEWLAERGPPELPLREVALDHVTVSAGGTVDIASNLHVPTQIVVACGIGPKLLIASQRIRLMVALGARITPSAIALKLALNGAEADEELLFRRLEAYRHVANLSELTDEAIVRIEGHVFAPSKLKLSGNPDFWGAWRTLWPVNNLTPDRIALATDLGVVNVRPTSSLSRDFFVWINEGKAQRIVNHQRQILRHLKDYRAGPLHWWSGEPNLPCLLVRKGQGLELTTFRRATSGQSMAFLPDFPLIHTELLRRDSRRSLIVTHLPDVSGTIFEKLRALRLRSLKVAVGYPVSISTETESEARDVALEALLRRLQSREIKNRLVERLEVQEIPRNHLVNDWRRVIETIKGIRLASGLSATFELGLHRYKVEYPGGLDDRGLIWIDTTREPIMAFYDAVASRLFQPEASSHAGSALRRAIEQPFESGTVENDEEERDGLDRTGKPAGAPPPPPPPPLKTGHGLAPGALDPIVPNPLPIKPQGPKDEKGDDNQIRKPRAPRPRSGGDDKRDSAERESVRNLKDEHYGAHCQVCLGGYEVEALTPSDSYLCIGAYRRRILQGHHVDHLQNEGGKGEANIIVLCQYHHDLLGDQLTGSSISKALLTAEPMRRVFPRDNIGLGVVAIDGLAATVLLDADPFRVTLFFTREHAAAWRAAHPVAP
jgi:hypothetical protein